eukprot:715594-Pleurochrysis_carterae.AAC.1
MPKQLPPAAMLPPSPILADLTQPPPTFARQPNVGSAAMQAKPHPRAATCVRPSTSCLYSHPL